jgi:hypothetical protein
MRNPESLAIGGLIVALVGGALFWTLMPAPEPLAPVAQPTSSPSPAPTPEPWVEPQMWAHWPSCSTRPMVQAQEDAALRAILASPLTDDPLWGGSVIRIEAAECAARRDRLAWMK